MRISWIFLFFFAATATATVDIDKKPASELNWNTEEQSNCIGKLCFGSEKKQSKSSPDMFEMIDKSNRERRTDPFSQHNSDDGNDGEKPRFGFSFGTD
ncbi:hypothetical protein [Buttiauxella ferragutiae]|uniref:hypothetical protein n=1 Tax=Buttiauxella ferragutiae TaxID=82989 RepID=UPI00352528F5